MEPSRGSRPRTSWLAALGFLSGLAAAFLVVSGLVLYMCASMGDALMIERAAQKVLFFAARLVLLFTTAPAVAAFAFWLASRGAVRESGGTLRGTGLYRTGLVLAILSLAATFGGRRSLGALAEAGARELSDVPIFEPVRSGPFTSLGRQVDAEAMDDGRIAVVRTVLATRKLAVLELAEICAAFTFDSNRKQAFDLCLPALEEPRLAVHDVRKILSGFGMDEGRLHVIAACAPVLEDPENNYLLIGGLTFESSKTRASEILRERAAKPGPRREE